MSQVEGRLLNQVILGRYKALKLIEAVEPSSTYSGIDEQTQKPILIKTLSTAAPELMLKRFEHESQVLSKFNSPWLPTRIADHRENDLYCLILSFVPGETLEARLKRGALSVHEAFRIGQGILLGLIDAHALGVFHRDIKPANIIVSPDPDSITSALIDFGLAQSGYLEEEVKNLPVGTIRYISPEQAGLVQHEVSAASDLYSWGLVFYECVTGKPLFDGMTVSDVLRQHLVLSPSDLQPFGWPRVAFDFLQRLLHKDPTERYQSAKAVLEDLIQIHQLVESGISNGTVVMGRSDLRRTLTEPTLVSRESELKQLMEMFHLTLRGEGNLTFLDAQSGSGKTRLLGEFVKQVRGHSAVRVIEGQSVDQAAQQPLQILDGLTRQLIQAVDQDPTWVAEVKRGLGDQVEPLIAVLPQLKQVFSGWSAGGPAGGPGHSPTKNPVEKNPEDGPEAVPEMAPEALQSSLGLEAHGEARTLPALTTLFESLGSAHRPVLLIFDDAHWADDLTLKAIEHWARYVRATPRKTRHIQMVIAYRSYNEGNPDSPRSSPRLFHLKPSCHITLKKLNEKEVQQVLESMAGPLPTEAVDWVIRLSDGNPFFAVSILQGMVETQALVGDAQGWQVKLDSLHEIQSSRKAALFLTRRLALLPPQSLEILALAAVLGKRFESRSLAMLWSKVSGEENPIAENLKEPLARQLIWADIETGYYSFAHDKIREALIEGLSPEQFKAYHWAAAELIENSGPHQVFEISYHLSEAGQEVLALPYAVKAAESARARYSIEIAENHYRIAEKGATQVGSPEVLQSILDGLGDVLMLKGDYVGATEKLDAARKLAVGNFAQAQIDRKLGELAFKKGDMTVASEALERGLRLLGKVIPQRKASFALLLFWELGVQVAHTLFPSVFVGKRKLDLRNQSHSDKNELLAVRLYGRLCYAWFFQRGVIPTLWAHLRELNLAERYPPTPELGQAYSTHAPVMSMIPYSSRAIRYGLRGVEIRKSLRDLWGEGQAYHFYGAALFVASRFGEALEAFQQGIQLLERTGDRWEVNGASYHVAFCLYRLGNLKGAIEMSRKVHEAGLVIGDAFASGASLDIWSRASLGAVPAEKLQIELKRTSDDRQRLAEVLQADGLRLLHQGHPVQAAEQLKLALETCAEAGVRNEYVSSISSWYSTSLRYCAEQAVAPVDPRKRRLLLLQARKAALQGVKLGHSLKNHLPQALRELGWVEASLGRDRKAIQHFEESLKWGMQQHARYEVACTRFAQGYLGVALNWPGAHQELSESKNELLNFGVEGADLLPRRGNQKAASSVSMSLVDRFDSVLNEARTITSALHERQIYERVREAALRLLRAEECLIVQKSSETDDPYVLLPHDSRLPVSQSLVKRVLESGKIEVYTEGIQDDPSESLVLSGARSILCAPILFRGKVTRCIYASHQQLSRFFSDEERRLAEFIVTLASTALENAAGFRDVQALSEDLKSDVARRQEVELKLHSALSEKEVLLREVYHRTKNNMQVISSLLNLQASDAKDSKDVEILRESQNRVRSLSLIHEKLYQSKDLVNINLKDYIQDLVDGLVRSYHLDPKRIDLKIEVEEISLQIDTVVPCGLLINELVSNSLKYAFAPDQRGEIQVIFRKSPVPVLEGEFELIVKDNGKGIPDGFDIQKSNSLGLKLVTGLVNGQLQGKLKFIKENGTQIHIQFRDGRYVNRLTDESKPKPK